MTAATRIDVDQRAGLVDEALYDPALKTAVETAVDWEPAVDEAPLGDAQGGAPRRPEPWHRNLLKSVQVSALLRMFGAGVVVAAIGMFLFQHWEAGNDLLRYAMLLGQTVLLCGLGFATSKLLREPKSARAFIALGLVSVAASFTILGALLYSTVQWDAIDTVYPSYAYWRAESFESAMGWIAGSLVLLIPVSVTGYLVLARPVARPLSALFIVNASLLLLPVRDPAVTAAIAALAGIVSFTLLARLARRVPAMRTNEGHIARIACILPVAIIAGRGASLYAGDAVSIACLGLLAYVTLRQMAINSADFKILARLLESSSILPAAATAFACAEMVEDWAGYRVDAQMALGSFFLVLVLTMLDLARRSHVDGRLYARAALLLGLSGALLELVCWPSMGTALLCVLVAAACAVHARLVGFSFLYRLALVCGLVGLGAHLYLALQSFDIGGWLGLAVLGAVAIVLAAAIERHGETLRRLLSAPRHGEGPA
ncbi:MAG: hypothetical protein KDK91_26505 [Gammaproteobacteria bacterium]|nr:hypothetical protein [Gammaproteobacteria bacterium]